MSVMSTGCSPVDHIRVVQSDPSRKTSRSKTQPAGSSSSCFRIQQRSFQLSMGGFNWLTFTLGLNWFSGVCECNDCCMLGDCIFASGYRLWGGPAFLEAYSKAQAFVPAL